LDGEEPESNTYIKVNDSNERVLCSSSGEELMILPEDITTVKAHVEETNHKLLIYIKVDKSNDKESIYSFLDTFDKKTSTFYNPGDNPNPHKYNLYIKNPNDDESFKQAAEYLYNSFKVSNYTLSLRIPT